MNLPEQTAKSFVRSPFAADDCTEAQSRMYRTGDLCRWLPDGIIGYIWRINIQVKLRGFQAADGVVLQVSDTGIGISEDDLQRVGRPFEQVVGHPRREANPVVNGDCFRNTVLWKPGVRRSHKDLRMPG